MSKIDEAKAIRSGEELNIEKLAPFLREQLHLEGELVIQQFPSGFSNLTYLIKLGDQEMVLRRPPFGAENISKGHDMGREYKVLSLINPVFPKSPRPLVYTEDLDIIGAPFYVMERVNGIILRANQKIDFPPETVLKLNKNLIENFADLHLLDIEKTGLIHIGKPEGYLERQVKGWTKRYHKAKTHDIPDMDTAMEWLAAHMPESPTPTFIHNDYKYDNVVLDPNEVSQIKAVLDWEMSTVGDPLTDLGIVLGYSFQKGDPDSLINFGINFQSPTLSRDEMVALYEEKTQRKVQHLPFYYAFALFKLGVVVQQIYYRYHEGYTKDPRFAPLIYMAKDCAKLAVVVIKSQKISDF